MGKKLIGNVTVMHHTPSPWAEEKIIWSFNDHLPARRREGVLRRGDWCSFVVMERSPGCGTSIMTRASSQLAALEEQARDRATFSSMQGYLGCGIAQVK